MAFHDGTGSCMLTEHAPAWKAISDADLKSAIFGPWKDAGRRRGAGGQERAQKRDEFFVQKRAKWGRIIDLSLEL